jgi:hypothetical protein
VEWTYEIVKSVEIRRDPTIRLVPEDTLWGICGGRILFGPGEIDQILYEALVGKYPECVTKIPKNPLIAAVYAARTPKNAEDRTTII